MIEISSYIRKLRLDNSQTLTIDDFFNVEDQSTLEENSGWFEHEEELMYLPGFISIKYNGKELLGVEYWDYVYWMWTSFYKRGEKIRNSKAFSIEFSDQPIKIEFHKQGEREYFLKIVENENVVKEYKIYDDKLIDKIIDAALYFFESISRYSKSPKILQRIKDLKEQY